MGRMGDFINFRDISIRMGKNKEIIQLSGGNTSIKDNKNLWIKASGKRLSMAESQPIFASIPLDPSMEDLHEIDKHIPENFSTDNLRPSIETSMHLYLPHKVILHSHPYNIIALSISTNAERLFSNYLPSYQWRIIPYIQPGRQLGLAVKETYYKSNVQILILQNHGLIIAANEPLEAERLQNDVLACIRINKRKTLPLNKELLSKYLSFFRGSSLPDNPIIHSLATDISSLKLAKMLPPYPDHVVFCGVSPLIIKPSDDPDSIDIEGKKYILIEGVGVILLGAGNEALQEMLETQAEIFLRVRDTDNVNMLTLEDCHALINWEAEVYRSRLINEVENKSFK